jgi:8-oxo-dGTP diphosphatase
MSTLPRPTVAVAAIVFDADGRVLAIERGEPPGVGLWSLPGGKQEPGETLAQAVVREVREETGLDVEVGELACVVERMGVDYHYVILDYYARVTGGELAAASDARAARFVTLEELAALPHTAGLLGTVSTKTTYRA